MNMRPDGIPQDVWDVVDKIQEETYFTNATETQYDFDCVIIARAIMAAEKRGEERERQACVEVAAYFGSSNAEYLPEEVVLACGHTADDIAVAIRKRGQAHER